MALYWPDKHVALEFLDDPDSTPFMGDDEDVKVLQATSEDMADPDMFSNFVHRLAKELGYDLPDEDDEDYDPIRAYRNMTYDATDR